MSAVNFNQVSKDKLKNIIDGLFVQICTIGLCLDTLSALKEIGSEKIQSLKANNFFYITHTSLIFRFQLELNKLVKDKKAFNINAICELVRKNCDYFEDPEKIKSICEDLEKKLKKYEKINSKLSNRRNKVFAHNKVEYYFYSAKKTDKIKNSPCSKTG